MTGLGRDNFLGAWLHDDLAIEDPAAVGVRNPLVDFIAAGVTSAMVDPRMVIDVLVATRHEHPVQRDLAARCGQAAIDVQAHQLSTQREREIFDFAVGTHLDLQLADMGRLRGVGNDAVMRHPRGARSIDPGVGIGEIGRRALARVQLNHRSLAVCASTEIKIRRDEQRHAFARA